MDTKEASIRMDSGGIILKANAIHVPMGVICIRKEAVIFLVGLIFL